VRVILKQDVAKLGGAGDIVDVADGYANNFLVPRDLAMRATRGATKDAEAMGQARQKREARTLGDARELKATLEAAPVRISAKAGEDGTLYGSVGNSAIADALRSQLGIRLDRRRIPLDRPLKTLGGHDINVRVHPDLTATLRVEIVRGG
jgi:large subunit ribosomal protein L9